ncbi:MobA/MobL family protein, partial [Klebsiella oxytoca]
CMEWNRAVDRAIVSGLPEVEILELKKTEITDRVKESVEQNGNKPELFGDIVRAAILLLERLIAKVMQKAMDFAEK